ncbi:cAMP-dependent protein kinase catalytic subunit [Hypoxylon texense]
MDNFIFRQHIIDCETVEEKTTYLEILNYSDPAWNVCEEHPLTDDEFENFLNQRGAFAPPKLAEGVKFQDGIRLIVQKDACQDDTFAPLHISLKPEAYESMVRTWHLPFGSIESSSLVGPFFWCSNDHDEEDRHLQIIFRKSDVRKKGKTRGWEIMLSYSYNTGITTGFVKGTESSDITTSLRQLTACFAEVGHPLLLPIIILSHDLSSQNDKRQREARDWLRRLENAITLRNEIDEKEVYSDFDVDGINRDLVECHSRVLWKRPQAYQEIVKEFKEAMTKFIENVPAERNTNLKTLHSSMLSRLDFYRVKLTGMEHYIHTTLERLHIQRQALYNIMAQKESKLNLEIASQQRRLAHATKRDGTAMKTLSLLGAVFLPGTFMASVFSMTFFDFNVGPNFGDPSDSSGEGAQVSNQLWIYFVVTIPLTLIIVLSWYFIDRRRERKYAEEDVEIEKGIDTMEKDILAIMRKKTINKATTWNSGGATAAAANRARMLAIKEPELDAYEMV